MKFLQPLSPALLCLALTIGPTMAEDWNGLLLDRNLAMPVPEGFAAAPVFANADGGSAIVEFVPQGETELDWSQMLTLTAYDDGSDAPADQLALGMANHLAEGFASICPASFSVEDLGAPMMAGAEVSFAGWLSCGANGAGQSESMAVLIVATSGTIYTAQWAERGPESSAPLPFDPAIWLPRLDALMALRF